MHFIIDNGINRSALPTLRASGEDSEASWEYLAAASHPPAALCKSDILNTPHQRQLLWIKLMPILACFAGDVNSIFPNRG